MSEYVYPRFHDNCQVHSSMLAGTDVHSVHFSLNYLSCVTEIAKMKLLLPVDTVSLVTISRMLG